MAIVVGILFLQFFCPRRTGCSTCLRSGGSPAIFAWVRVYDKDCVGYKASAVFVIPSTHKWCIVMIERIALSSSFAYVLSLDCRRRRRAASCCENNLNFWERIPNPNLSLRFVNGDPHLFFLESIPTLDNTRVFVLRCSLKILKALTKIRFVRSAQRSTLSMFSYVFDRGTRTAHS